MAHAGALERLASEMNSGSLQFWVPEGFVTLLIPPVVLSVPQAEFRLPEVQPIDGEPGSMIHGNTAALVSSEDVACAHISLPPSSLLVHPLVVGLLVGGLALPPKVRTPVNSNVL